MCSRPTDDLNGMILEGGGTCRADSGSVLPLPAILRDEQFVQLDEAISALDTRPEKQFQQAIDVLISRSSMIMAAHRLNTIRKAGRIIRVNEGHVELSCPMRLCLWRARETFRKWKFPWIMQRILQTKIEGRTA